MTKATAAYGASDAYDVVVGTYSNNGKQATLADALGSLTTYEYDGFDRVLKVRYPNAAVGSRTTSSTTDYEGYSYDAASNVTQVRRRDGQTDLEL